MTDDITEIRKFKTSSPISLHFRAPVYISLHQVAKYSQVRIYTSTTVSFSSRTNIYTYASSGVFWPDVICSLLEAGLAIPLVPQYNVFEPEMGGPTSTSNQKTVLMRRVKEKKLQWNLKCTPDIPSVSEWIYHWRVILWWDTRENHPTMDYMQQKTEQQRGSKHVWRFFP